MGDPAWLTIEHGGERRHVRLDLKLTTIGRNEANVVDLADKGLSRFHCEIERRGDDYVVRDAGSRNGTTLNGVKLAGPTVLAAGDKIEIGNALLLFRIDRPIDADPANQLMPIAPLPRSMRRATTKRQEFEIDLSGATPEEAFDPRPTMPQTPAHMLARTPVPPPPPPPPETPRVTRSLARAALALAATTSAEELARRVVELALDLVPARQASLFLGRPGARAAASHPPGEEPRASSALCEEVVNTAAPVSVQDLKQDPRWGIQYSVLGLDLRGAIAAPLLALGKPRGVLYVDEPRAVGREEREEATALVAGLAALAGLALVGVGGALAGDEDRALLEAARAARLAASALSSASTIDAALRVRPGTGAFAETEALPERGGIHEVAILCGLAQGPPLAALGVEHAARAAFRALARSAAKPEALLPTLARALEPVLAGSSLPVALFRLNPLSGEVYASLAGVGPLLHRSKEGDVFGIEGAPSELGASFGSCEEHAIAWAPGDLLLLAAEAPEDLRVAPWVGQTTKMSATAALERSVAELPEAALVLALVRS